MTALNKLEEMGLRPEKKKTRKPEESIATLEEISKDRKKIQQLDLLIEGLSETDTRELIIYGVYVKKHLASLIPVSRERRIEKTLEYLSRMIENFTKSSELSK